MKNSCELYPIIKGQPSELYKGLASEKFGGRPIANIMYAAYLQPGVKAMMNNAGYKVNSQGQHSAEDVFKYFEGNKLLNEQAVKTDTLAINLGAKNSDGSFVDFKNPEDAYVKALNFNSSNEGKLAYVVQHGDAFHVVIDDLSSRNIVKKALVSEEKLAWDYFMKELNAVGITSQDLAFAFDSINPIHLPGIFSYLNVLKTIQNDKLSRKDIRTLLTFNKGESLIQQALSRWGTIENSVEEIFKTLESGSPAGVLNFVNNVLNKCKTFNSLDLKSIENNIKREIFNFESTSEEIKLDKTISSLDSQYNINKNIIEVKNKEITKLTEVIAAAILSLQRQIEALEAKSGKTSKTKDLNQTLQQLTRELEGKKNYIGILKFLSKGLKQLNTIDSLYNNLPNTGSLMEQISNRSEVLIKIKGIINAYYKIADALSSVNNLLTEENMTQQEIDNIQNTAKVLKESLEKQSKRFDSEAERIATEVCTDIFGTDSSVEAKDIRNFIDMAEADASLLDLTYSFSKLTNPVAAALGSVFKQAQDNKRQRMIDISNRIRLADRKLKKAGHDSSFMYEIVKDKSGIITDVYIKSDINWEAYNEARKTFIGRAMNAGMKGIDLKIAIETWEENNTIPEIVDSKSGRTEMLPSALFRGIDFSKDWDNAQIEYYNTMMQIKGEIGSLMPSYAQHQYKPAQIRGTTLDIIKSIKEGRFSFKEGMSLIKDNTKKWLKLETREDDTNYAKNGINIEGEYFNNTKTDFDGTVLKRIPMFYVSKLEDQKDLLFDFSGSLQSLAGAAITYDEMSKIQNVVEVMRSFIDDQDIKEKSYDSSLAYTASTAKTWIVQKVVKTSKNTRTSAIINGLIDKYMYGQTYTKEESKLGKFFRGIIRYSSVTKLMLNLPSYLNNISMGEIQAMIEAGAGEFYNPKNLLFAHLVLFGNNTVKAPGKIMDMLTNNIESLEALISMRFDPNNETFSKLQHERYHTSMFRKLFGEASLMSGYSSSEYFLQQLNLYAILDHEKVLVDGKKVSLYSALRKKENTDGSVLLILADNTTDLNGNSIEINDEYVDSIRKKVRNVVQALNGAMNEEDKGSIHRTALGKGIMNFRQWMISHYSRRFRSGVWNNDTGRFEEGYWTTVGKKLEYLGIKAANNTPIKHLLAEFAKEGTQFAAHLEALDKYENLTEHQRANIRRAMSEVVIWGMLNVLIAAIGSEKDYKGDFWMRLLIYVLKRTEMETGASVPSPALLKDATKLMESPFPSISTIQGTLYPLYGWYNDYGVKYESGPNKGKDKYITKSIKGLLPTKKVIDNTLNIDTRPDMFNYLNK